MIEWIRDIDPELALIRGIGGVVIPLGDWDLGWIEWFFVGYCGLFGSHSERFGLLNGISSFIIPQNSSLIHCFVGVI